MRLSLGISTCPNDTYIYEALVQGLEKSPFEWDVHFADVQTLNEMVRRGELDVAKVRGGIRLPWLWWRYRVWLRSVIAFVCRQRFLPRKTGRFARCGHDCGPFIQVLA